MNFEWDKQKNQINIRKHGFDFADAWKVFGFFEVLCGFVAQTASLRWTN